MQQNYFEFIFESVDGSWKKIQKYNGNKKEDKIKSKKKKLKQVTQKYTNEKAKQKRYYD